MTHPVDILLPDFALFATLRTEFDITNPGDGACGSTEPKLFDTVYHGSEFDDLVDPPKGYHAWARYKCPRIGCGATWRARQRTDAEIRKLAKQRDVAFLMALGGVEAIEENKQTLETIERLRKDGYIETGWEYIPCQRLGKAHRSSYIRRTTKGYARMVVARARKERP